MVERAFQFLFKFRPLVFEQGELVLGVSRLALAALLLAGAVGAYAVFTYFRASGSNRRDRLILACLRLGILGLILFCLARPTLILKAAVPQQNFLGVLLDDSRSMQIADRAGQPRSDFIRQNFSRADGGLLQALSNKFVIRALRFSSSAERLPSPTANLAYEGSRTNLGQALDRARDELAGLPLAGLVVVTDGADTSDAALDQSLASLKARSIPVFTIGLGQERFARDIQITRVETPRAALKGTSIVVDVLITQTGYAGATVPLQVEDEGQIVAKQDVTLPPDGESETVRVRVTADHAGSRVFSFRVPPQPDEQVVQNNIRESLVEVSDRREKLLYMEGEPRFEAKFVRENVVQDNNLQVVILDRTAQDKYLRLDVGDSNELVGGFPKTREELFAYRGIILGSIEAASFTPEQQRMLADFVSRRGGGLLMLGGRRSFAEGGWAGTPLADVLPVVVEGAGKQGTPYFAELAIRPTRDGAVYPVTQIADTEPASASRWDALPMLTSVNAIRSVKPGATVLLTGADRRNTDQIVLAFQRYGRGKAIAFVVQDSWQWRMDVKMPVTDTTFATFWRRLTRWVVDGVPDHVIVTTAQDRVDPGEAVRLSAQVVDPAFIDVNDARVVAHVTSPSGKSTDVPMDWIVSHDGEYRGNFVPDEEGLYEVKVDARRDQKNLDTNTIHVRVAPGDREYFDATMRAPLLQRVAEETGGRFFTEANAAGLSDAISYTGRGVTVVEQHDLWDMPVVLLLLIGLTGTEWAYRRARGLA